MLISIGIWVIYFGWGIRLWVQCPPLLSEQDFAKPELQYCYTTTLGRRWSVVLGALFLFASLLWLLTMAISEFFWRELLVNWLGDVGYFKIGLMSTVVVIILATLRVPLVKRFATEVAIFFQRCQFFPILPSPKEETLISQLSKLPIDVLPPEIAAMLAQDTQDLEGDHIQSVYDDYRRLEVLYLELQQLAKRHQGIIRRFYFGGEWELIKNQFAVIDRQMHNNNSDADFALARKIQTCLYFCYNLLTRVIVETSANAQESRELFRHYGFKVDVSD